MHRLRQVACDRPACRPPTCPVATASIFGPAGPQPLPERLQGVGPLAVADEHHRAAVQVQHDRQVAVALADGDLVDGDVPQVLELGLGIAARQVALLDVLDQVPADAQVRGHVADGHPPGEVQHVPLEGLGVAPPRVGEGDLDLTHHPTGTALDARDGEHQGRRARADGQGPEASLDVTARDQVAGTAGRAPAALGLLADGEDHLSFGVGGADVAIAPGPERVIQQAGGHADLRSWSPVTQLQVESACPPFSTRALASAG